MFHVDITRNTRTPKLCLYPIEYALTKNNKESENWSKKVQEYDPNPIFIPSYQRPIVWGGTKIKDFINSTSKLFGSVILVSTDMNKPIILLDGFAKICCIYCDFKLFISSSIVSNSYTKRHSR